MDIAGLIFEILFLGIGVYLYLFVRGIITFEQADKKEKADAFRKENGWWLRLLSIALVAVMIINIVLHIQDMMK